MCCRSLTGFICLLIAEEFSGKFRMLKMIQCKRRLINFLALYLVVSLIHFCSCVKARIRHYKWEVRYEYKSPDCYKKLVMTINGRTPGPTIFAQQGDIIVVELKNSLLTHNVVIHWHGIRQIGTPWSDGTEGVTQCPILPGDTFIYKFVVDKAGTYLYHGHYGMQKEGGLYGTIIVSLPAGVSEPFYDNDGSIVLNDWYHASDNEQVTGLSSIPFVFVGEPQSLFINGRGKYNCPLLSTSKPGLCNASNPECSPYALTLFPGKTYRLRIGSVASLSALSFEIEGHNLTVVEADGNYVEPFVTRNLYIYSGETYSVLVETNQNPSRNYWITTNVVSRKPETPTGLAILSYHPNQPQNTLQQFQLQALWNDTTSRLAQSQALKARRDFINPPPLTSDRMIVLLNTQNKINGYYKWSLNNLSLVLPQTPYLIAFKENLTNAFDQNQPPDSYDYVNYDVYSVAKNLNASSSNRIYRLKFNSTVDIILQNANTMTVNNSETHPRHLHGHEFWVLGYGVGKFDVFNDWRRYNLVNPVMKNTVSLHPYGWTALRFRADNPGVWIFHCHIESHLYMGMGVVFEERVERLENLPSSIMGCGETKGYHHHRP